MYFHKTLFATTMLITVISLALVGKTALANKSVNPNDIYTVKIIENCQVITEIPLNQQQTQAYLALKDEENKMAKLQAPIMAIEDKLGKYSQQIEQLSQQIFTDSKQPFQVDNAVLAKQALVVKKLDNLMAKHQADFDALGTQGRNIGDIADRFTQLITPLIANNKHHQVSIGRRDENPLNYFCNSNRSNAS